MKNWFFFLLLLGSSFLGSAQVVDIDNVLWGATQIRKQISDDWSFQFQPIIRYNNDISSYQNFSLDFSVRRKISDHWFGQVVSRTWLVPDVRDRQFLWIDIGTSAKLPALKLSMTNRLRWHHAFDFNDRKDPNYLRYLVQVLPITDWKLKPSFAMEYWLQLGDLTQTIQGRIIPGLRYSFNNKLGITLNWMIQYVDLDGLSTRQNLWNPAIVYKI